jgi:hypothetical protein
MGCRYKGRLGYSPEWDVDMKAGCIFIEGTGFLPDLKV